MAATLERVARSAAPSSPFIGRRDAWAQVMTSWRRMVRGGAGLVVIGGEAGIGKSRLAAELCEWASPAGDRPGEHPRLGGRGPAGLRARRRLARERRADARACRDWTRARSARSRASCRSCWPSARTCPGPRRASRTGSDSRSSRRSRRRSSWPSSRSLLVLDDLQWCDADTLEWLHFLLRTGRDSRLLVVGTMRSEEVGRAAPGGPCSSRRCGIRQPAAEIDLGPLDARRDREARRPGRRPRPAAGRPRATCTRRPRATRCSWSRRSGRSRIAVTPAPVGRDPSGDEAGRTQPSPCRRRSMRSSRRGSAQLSGPARDVAAVAATVGRAFDARAWSTAPADAAEDIVGGRDRRAARAAASSGSRAAAPTTSPTTRSARSPTRQLTEARRRLLHRRVAEALRAGARRHPRRRRGPDRGALRERRDLADRAAAFYQSRGRGRSSGSGPTTRRSPLLTARASRSSSRCTPGAGARRPGARAAGGPRRVARGDRRVRRGRRSATSSSGAGSCATGSSGRSSPPILRALATPPSLAQARIDDCHALGDRPPEARRARRRPDAPRRGPLRDGHGAPAGGVARAGARDRARGVAGQLRPARGRPSTSACTRRTRRSCASIRLAVDLWLLGDSDGAARRRDESLALAAELGHPFSRGYALTWDAILECLRGDAGAPTSPPRRRSG